MIKKLLKTLIIGLMLLVGTQVWAAITMVPTFECVGISWAPTGKGAANEAVVEYRKDGDVDWIQAQSLWYDAREGAPYDEEYRGSIVGLSAGTTYNVRLTLQADPFTTETDDVTTWPLTFPEGVITGITDTNSMLTISDSGTADAYRVYQPASGISATIDVNNLAAACITVSAGVHHVIIRNLILLDGSNYGIELEKETSDIVIEGCDISNWGSLRAEVGGDNMGVDYEAGIYFYDDGETGPARIIIQRNKIHEARYDTNSWQYGHPYGPQGIALADSEGNHVIRYNEIYGSGNGDEGGGSKYFNDGMGFGTNFSNNGFPGKDLDIYGNIITHCWDEGIEAEGGGENVRIWGNYTNQTVNSYGLATVTVGPFYLFRNVSDTSRYYDTSDDSDSDDFNRGDFIKAGDGAWEGGTGRVYVYHNTTLQQTAGGKTYTLGHGALMADAGGGDIYELVTRNNIGIQWKNWRTIMAWGTADCTNSSDYDLYIGGIDATKCADPAPEANGINAAPTYAANNGDDEADSGAYRLADASEGHEDGVVLQGFNTDTLTIWEASGTAPDMGVMESDAANDMEFGITAEIDTTTITIGTVYSNSFMAYPNVLNLEEGATGCDIYNVTNRGILDLDEGIDGIYNSIFAHVDLSGIAVPEEVKFYNCKFAESQATIEATLGTDGTATFDADCEFEIVTATHFNGYSSNDLTLKPGSSFRHGGTYTPGYETKLRPAGGTMDDILSIGAYAVPKGAAGM